MNGLWRIVPAIYKKNTKDGYRYAKKFIFDN